MKKTILTFVIASSAIFAHAQNSPLYIWGGGLDGSTYQKTAIYSTDDFGLLIEAPLNSSGSKLPINFSWRGGGVSPLRINGDGNVGIGTATPNYKLGLSNGATISFNQDPINPFGIEGGDHSQTRIIMGASSGTASNISFGVSNGSGYAGFAEKLRITSGGNVGIGTSTPDAKLAVNGTIHTKEVKVDLQNWPDYVFKPDYQLPSLSEVKAYINKNQHLPDMPSEQEVTKNGVNLGEINKLLTKKVEELTLYVIEQKEELNEQQKQLTEQQQKSAKQDKRITELEKALLRLTSK